MIVGVYCFIFLIVFVTHSFSAAVFQTPIQQTPIVARQQKDDAPAPMPFDYYPFLELTKKSYDGQHCVTSYHAPCKIEAYFSPTCGHCAQYFKDMRKNNFIDTYVATEKARFYIRPYCMNAIDCAVCCIAGIRGEEWFLHFFCQFIEKHEDWVGYYDPNKSPEEKQKILENLQKKYDINLHEFGPMPFFKSETTDTLASSLDLSAIVVMALSLGFTKDEIIEAIMGSKGEELYGRFLLTQECARNERNEPIAALPAFYINGHYKDALYYKDVVTIIDKMCVQ